MFLYLRWLLGARIGEYNGNVRLSSTRQMQVFVASTNSQSSNIWMPSTDGNSDRNASTIKGISSEVISAELAWWKRTGFKLVKSSVRHNSTISESLSVRELCMF